MTSDSQGWLGQCTNPACTHPETFSVPLTPNSVVNLACRLCGVRYSLHVTGDSPPLAKFEAAGSLTTI